VIAAADMSWATWVTTLARRSSSPLDARLRGLPAAASKLLVIGFLRVVGLRRSGGG